MGVVAVVGSANLDTVYRVERIPTPGETVLATEVAVHPGGKGANQVIAASRAGADAVFIGAVGNDEAAEVLLGALSDAGVRRRVRRPDVRTGSALIVVDDSGENTIVVDAGANATLEHLAEEELDEARRADVVLLQLEVPMATVQTAASVAHGESQLVLLNAAPYAPLEQALLEQVDVLILNEHEAELAAGSLGSTDVAALLRAVPAVIVTLGGDGCEVVTADGRTRVLGRRVPVVDTTGAGDTFCGVLAATLALSSTRSHDAFVVAAERANAAASIAVQRAGAVPSIPLAEEIDELLRRAGSERGADRADQ